MIALRIIAGIVGLWLFWLYTFSTNKECRLIWGNVRGTTILVVVLVGALALLQFALAGHL